MANRASRSILPGEESSRGSACGNRWRGRRRLSVGRRAAAPECRGPADARGGVRSQAHRPQGDHRAGDRAEPDRARPVDRERRVDPGAAGYRHERLGRHRVRRADLDRAASPLQRGDRPLRGRHGRGAVARVRPDPARLLHRDDPRRAAVLPRVHHGRVGRRRRRRPLHVPHRRHPRRGGPDDDELARRRADGGRLRHHAGRAQDLPHARALQTRPSSSSSSPRSRSRCSS